jgi:hypothetical protein
MGALVRKLPVLSSADRPFFPSNGHCPNCGRALVQGFAYLSAGALLLSADGQDSIHTDRLQAFLNVGFHGVDSEMRDSSDIEVIADLHGGQFDLQWCSIACMRQWLNALLDQVERGILSRSKANDASSPQE